MDFVTEMDLRSIYKQQPFDTYKISPAIRITPGARQFLIDNNIKIINPEQANQKEDIHEISKDKPTKKVWQEVLFESKLKSAYAAFLCCCEQILDSDVLIAQKIVDLSKSFKEILTLELEQELIIECPSCLNENEKHFDQGDCFEINEFHAQLKKGKVIVKLNHIRSLLREIEPIALMCFSDSNELINYKISKINQIINVLSHLICLAVGGDRCQR